MTIEYHEEGDEKRQEEINAILPKQTIISEILEPLIQSRLFRELALCVRKELEVYRNYPKREREEPIDEMLQTFNPTNNETCYMGKAFKANHGDLQDIELVRYRKAIGTIPHYVWGNVTLLEIWGGDHFEDHPEMVVGAFEYGMKLRDDCPEIKFFTNPLFKNQKSKEFRRSAEQEEEKAMMDELMARAVVFGVRTPAEARRANKKR